MNSRRQVFCASMLLSSIVLLLLFVSSPSLLSQAVTADDVEKTIASLPPDQRVYERFRYWATSLPPQEQQSPNLQTRYREYLKGRGFTEADADAFLKIVAETMGRDNQPTHWAVRNERDELIGGLGFHDFQPGGSHRAWKRVGKADLLRRRFQSDRSGSCGICLQLQRRGRNVQASGRYFPAKR